MQQEMPGKQTSLWGHTAVASRALSVHLGKVRDAKQLLHLMVSHPTLHHSKHDYAAKYLGYKQPPVGCQRTCHLIRLPHTLHGSAPLDLSHVGRIFEHLQRASPSLAHEQWYVRFHRMYACSILLSKDGWKQW